MDNHSYSDDAKQTVEAFLSLQPVISRDIYRQKIDEAVHCQLLKTDALTASKEIVVRVLEEMFPTAEPLTLPLKDPAALEKMSNSLKQIDKINPIVHITRWSVPPIPLEHTVDDIFALLAGPRVGGNTDCIMDMVLSGAQETGCKIEKRHCATMTIQPCSGCFACEEKMLETYCSINDDMTDVYKRLLECDAFVLGFPIYTSRECGQASLFMDRLKAIFSGPWRGYKHKPKRGALVVTWAWPSEFLYRQVIYNCAFVLRYFGIDIAEVVTGCGFMGAYYQKGTAMLDQSGVASARIAGRSLALGKTE